ncbi:nitrogen fixation protein NifZ [Roseibium litorale]|uniref:Nitrogen fixation protein NifZ n=1 Tax=Roseibium litorale TaxID=2803841 RepID=A0ABR9CRA5_9HYPH|nr:nitrogen fixation protein NifZ [Roseibium litorale]MBD8893360.1 nitrogen fixation protein NifZ [Roseibium litorale]
MNNGQTPPAGNLPIEPRMPKYDWGQRVLATVDLHNDGSYPGAPEDGLLVAIGDMGEIVQVGMHTETNTPVYMVEFNGERVIGCLEDEISLL